MKKPAPDWSRSTDELLRFEFLDPRNRQAAEVVMERCNMSQVVNTFGAGRHGSKLHKDLVAAVVVRLRFMADELEAGERGELETVEVNNAV